MGFIGSVFARLRPGSSSCCRDESTAGAPVDCLSCRGNRAEHGRNSHLALLHLITNPSHTHPIPLPCPETSSSLLPLCTWLLPKPASLPLDSPVCPGVASHHCFSHRFQNQLRHQLRATRLKVRTPNGNRKNRLLRAAARLLFPPTRKLHESFIDLRQAVDLGPIWCHVLLSH